MYIIWNEYLYIMLNLYVTNNLILKQSASMQSKINFILLLIGFFICWIQNNFLHLLEKNNSSIIMGIVFASNSSADITFS